MRSGLEERTIAEFCSSFISYTNASEVAESTAWEVDFPADHCEA